MDKAQESLKRLFQQEFARMVAGISKRFGLDQIELAEDIVSETFLLATETWGVRGVPDHPAAWLHTVARQKTLYHFRRQKLLVEKVIPSLTEQALEEDDAVIDFTEQTIRDGQLQMLFAICTPLIAEEAQIGLALRILCGFGIDEIAEAFLTNRETISKRLFRAKEKLRLEQVRLELPPSGELLRRLDRVLHIIYLLFNEGYYSSTQNQTLRKDVCLEAMRLGMMLTEFGQTNQPKTNALLALMCFHASRFNARQGTDGTLLLYTQQDNRLWDNALIRRGFNYLEQSLQGDDLSTYHLEARIASWHCIKSDSPEKWADILALYNQLLVVNPSPSVVLNRTYALYKVDGRAAALTEAERLGLTKNNRMSSPFYCMLLGELYQESEPTQAAHYFQQAYSVAKTPTDKQTILLRLNALNQTG